MSIILKENIKSTVYESTINPYLVAVKSSRRPSFGEMILETDNLSINIYIYTTKLNSSEFKAIQWSLLEDFSSKTTDTTISKLPHM